MSPVPQDRPIFLVGFMGSGKSTVARTLAARLGWEAIDTDRLVAEREGRSIERIFRESGEGAFRRLEWEALVSLDGRRRTVVATGGGLFLAALQRKWLHERGTTVWLDASFEACLRRVGSGAGRPLWTSGEDPLALRAMFERRRATYALAAVRVPADGSADDCAGRILARVGPGFP